MPLIEIQEDSLDRMHHMLGKLIRFMQAHNIGDVDDLLSRYDQLSNEMIIHRGQCLACSDAVKRAYEEMCDIHRNEGPESKV